MSLLTIVQRFCQEINIDEPSTVMGTTDPQVKQIKALLQKEGDDLSGRGDWEVLVNEATLTTGVEGTTTLRAADSLFDSNASFISAERVQVGETVTNTTTGATATITTVQNELRLILSSDIFLAAGAGETYTINSEDQGAIEDIASNGFRYIRNDTFWDRDLRLPVYVIDATDWQQVKATAVTGPRYQARIRGGRLIANPVPVVGNTWAFEYVTWNWMTDFSGLDNKQYFTNDSDLPLLPQTLLEAGLQWRWKKQKGMEYAEDFRTYEMMVANELSRNGLKRPLKMHQGTVTPEPRVFVPDGSWSL